MVEITDDFMKSRLATVRPYATVLLRKGPLYQAPDVRSPHQAKIVLEHGRRNMRLQEEGKVALVGPLAGAGEIVGVSVFTVPEAEVRTLMDADGAVAAGIFVYDVVNWFTFPGDRLP